MISREIKRLIHKRNKYYKSYRKTGNSQLIEKCVSIRHTIRKKTKESHKTYLEGLLGADRQKDKATGQGNIKKLFQYLKNSRTNQEGIPPLKQNGNLHTETKEKANILNQQFQSVFTPLAPLSLQELSLMKVQDHVDDKVIRLGAFSENLRNLTPLMPDIKISEAGILNFLKNIIPKKAAGPDRIKNLGWNWLQLSNFFLNAPLSLVLYHLSGTQPMSLLYSRSGINQLLPYYRPISLLV